MSTNQHRTAIMSIVASALLMGATFAAGATALAADAAPDLVAQTGLANTGGQVGYGESDPTSIAATAIGIIFELAGTIFLVLCIYAGFLWMTAQGADEQIKKARAILKNSIVGLVLMSGSYVALRAIFDVIKP